MLPNAIPALLRAVATTLDGTASAADQQAADALLRQHDVPRALRATAQAVEVWSKVPKRQFWFNGVLIRAHYITADGNRVTFHTRAKGDVSEVRAAMAAKYGCMVGSVLAAPMHDDPEEWEVTLGGGIVEVRDA